MSELQIEGMLFRISKMDTRTQLFVVKRLAPVVQGMTLLFTRPSRTVVDADGDVVPDVNIFDTLAALANTVGTLSDQDAAFVLDHALACVAWRQNDRWVPLRDPSTGLFLLGAADALDIQLRLLWEVLRESLANFSFVRLLPFLTQTSNGMDQTEAPPAMGLTPMVGNA